MCCLQADATVVSVTLTPAQTLALYGSTISGYYCESPGVYRSCTFEYFDTVSNEFFSSSYTSIYDPDGRYDLNSLNNKEYLVYYTEDVGYSSTSGNIDFQFELVPSVSLNNLNLFSSSVLYVTGFPNTNSTGNYQIADYPSCAVCSIDGVAQTYDILPWSSSNLTRAGVMGFKTADLGALANSYVSVIPIFETDENSTFSFNYSRVDLFRCQRVYDSNSPHDIDGYFFLIECPTLSDGYTFVDPGTGGGSGDFDPEIVIANGYFDVDGNINIEIDLAQLLELLDAIAEKQGFTQDELDESLDEDGPLSWIPSAIGGVFMPDDDAFEDFSDSVSDSFNDHLGGISELGSIFDEQFDYLHDAVSIDSIYLGEIHAPVEFDRSGNALTYFTIGGWDVPLKPAERELSVLYDALYFMIDITAVLMVLNMLKTKQEIILNPEGECITYAD